MHTVTDDPAQLAVVRLAGEACCPTCGGTVQVRELKDSLRSDVLVFGAHWTVQAAVPGNHLCHGSGTRVLFGKNTS